MNINAAPIVLLAALCWMSVGTQAASPVMIINNTTSATMNSTTASPMMNNTTASATMTNTTASVMMTNTTASVMMNNTTASATMNNTTASATMNNTTASATMNNTTASAMMNNTTASAMMNNTTASATMNNTTASAMMNNTTASPTNNSTNATTAMANNTTAASNATTAAATTAPPIVNNETVVALTANISKDGCGSKKLCAAEPSDCDPTTGSCYFVGVKRKSGRNLDFELAGETEGYLGCILKSLSGKEKAYLCVNSNGKVIFIGASVINGTFINETLPVNNVKAKMNGKRIQCSFSATVPNSTAKADDTKFQVSVATGPYDAAKGELGPATTQIRTNAVDLTNTSANTTNTVTTNTTTNTTATPTTTDGTVPLQSVSSALLIVLGTLTLAWL